MREDWTDNGRPDAVSLHPHHPLPSPYPRKLSAGILRGGPEELAGRQDRHGGLVAHVEEVTVRGQKGRARGGGEGGELPILRVRDEEEVFRPGGAVEPVLVPEQAGDFLGCTSRSIAESSKSSA